MPMDNFMSRFGISFRIIRGEIELHRLTGLDNREKSTNARYVGFMPGTDVQANDILVNPAGDRFYVVDTRTAYFQGTPNRLMAYYQTEAEHRQASSGAAVYNIENAYGSIIGTGNTATINYDATIHHIKERIEQENSPDREDLEKIITLLEMIVNNQVPPSKGLFSKFRGVMERNAWISSSIASTILSWLMTQIP